MATNFVAKLPTPRTYRSVRSGIPTLGYRYLNVRINSVNDASMSRKNFVNFGPVTPEKTELICELFVRRGKKTSVFSRISQDILDRFLRSFHHMKAL